MTKKRPRVTKNTGVHSSQDYNKESLESQAITLIKSASEGNPIRRKTLAKRLGVDDRTARLVVEVLRHNGERIVAHEKGGYFYAENEKQYRKWRSGITARIQNMSRMLKSMDERTGGNQCIDAMIAALTSRSQK